jgi:hypothetical protein
MGDAEVGDDDAPVRTEQHMGRLHVPVHDADGVRGAQGTEHGEADPGGFGHVDRAAPEPGLQGLAGHQLHDDPRESVQRLGRVELVGAYGARAFVPLLGLHDHVVDGDGSGMIDAGGGPGLAVEPVGGPPVTLVVRVARQPGLSHGDLTLRELVAGPPDGARPTGADALDQPVTPADQPAPGVVRPAPVVAHDPSVPREAGPCRRGSFPGALDRRDQVLSMSRFVIAALATSRPRTVKSPLPG